MKRCRVALAVDNVNETSGAVEATRVEPGRPSNLPDRNNELNIQGVCRVGKTVPNCRHSLAESIRQKGVASLPNIINRRGPCKKVG